MREKRKSIPKLARLGRPQLWNSTPLRKLPQNILDFSNDLWREVVESSLRNMNKIITQ